MSSIEVSPIAGALGAEEVTMTDQVLFMASYNLEANFKKFH